MLQQQYSSVHEDGSPIYDNYGQQPEGLPTLTPVNVTPPAVPGPPATVVPPAVTPTSVVAPPPAPLPSPLIPTPTAPLPTALLPAPQTYGTVTPYTRDQLDDLMNSANRDKALTPWEKMNSIMEQTQKAGITVDDLTKVYGKHIVEPQYDLYKRGIKDYITTTFADTTKSDFDKAAAINQAANKYQLDSKEISQYTGFTEPGVKKIFDTFDQGLAGIAKSLSLPTVSDLDKTKGVLALQNKYEVTDDQIAKALGNNMTGKDVANYLDPVRNFGTNIQSLTSNPNKTAVDIQEFLDQAKKDPRIEGLYGLAIDKVQKMVPVLGLRDSISGNGSPEQLAKGYTDFVAAVNADPDLKEKYGAQADAIDKVAKMSQRIADEKYGGKLQPHMFETFLGLDQKSMADVPKQLEMTKSETRTITDSDGQTQTYTVPGEVKDTKGLNPLYTTIGSGEDQTQQLSGYTKPIKTAAGVTIDAQYDANGTLTGYRGRPEDKVWPQHRVGITGVWDANGKAKPEQRVETPGFAKSMMQDIAALGPIGQIAIMAATSGLGSLVSGPLQSALGSTLGKAVASGLVGGTMAEVGGGKFGKGFATGAIGSPVQALTQSLMGSLMPNLDTGNETLNKYVAQALPNLASSTLGAAINKQDISQAGLSSLVGSGTNMLTNNLINSAMPDTLTPEMQKMFTGVSGQLLSSLLQGQTPDFQKAIMSTIMQNMMSPSKAKAG